MVGAGQWRTNTTTTVSKKTVWSTICLQFVWSTTSYVSKIGVQSSKEFSNKYLIFSKSIFLIPYHFIWDYIANYIKRPLNFPLHIVWYSQTQSTAQYQLLNKWTFSDGHCYIANRTLLRANVVNAECGAAKIYGLRLGFSNSNLSSHT